MNSSSCQCGKCAGCRVFPVVYKIEGDKKFITRAQYLAETLKKEAQEIIRADKKASGLRKMIDNLPDDGGIHHAYATPLHLVKKPTREELEMGIPVCCKNESMQVSRFDNDMWYCRHCRKARAR